MEFKKIMKATVNVQNWNSVQEILYYAFLYCLFLQIVHTVSTLIPSLSHSVLEISPYLANKVLLSVSSRFSGDPKPSFYSFSCYGYLWQGS